MYCKHCGKFIPEELNSCPYCNTPVNKAPATASNVNILAIIGFVLAILSFFVDPWFLFSIAAGILSFLGYYKSAEFGLRNLAVAGIIIAIVEFVIKLISVVAGYAILFSLF